MFDEVIEKLKENAPYVAIGVAAGFLLRNVLEEMIESNELANYKHGHIDDCNT